MSLMGRQREDRLPLGRSVRRNTDEALEAVVLKRTKSYSRKRT